MTEQLFIKKAKQAIKMCDDELRDYPHEAAHLQLVWMSHILGSKKAIFFDISHLNEIYEVTYNIGKDVFYVDKYKKDYNNAIESDVIEV